MASDLRRCFPRPHERVYDWGTAHRSEAGDALVAHPGLVSGPIPYAKEGH